MRHTPRRVFVLMPFDDRFADVYDMVIRRLEESADVQVNRADDLPFVSQRIYDSIVGAIQEADIIVADLSGDNPNVFYELGYAHALNKIVIPITSSERLPFDVAGFPTVFYRRERLSELRPTLQQRLGEAVEILSKVSDNKATQMLPEYEQEMRDVERWALERAERAQWSRPAMYFTEEDVVNATCATPEHAYQVLDQLRKEGKVTCVNWRGSSVWMASQRN